MLWKPPSGSWTDSSHSSPHRASSSRSGTPFPRLGDARVVFLRREIGEGREQPEERRVGRGAVNREVTGVVPALHHTRRRQGGVAGVDPGALGVFRIDLGEGALVVEGALHGAHGRVEHARPDVEGVT